MPVLTGSVHAHILTKPSRAVFAVIRLDLIEPGAATCVYQAKACSPTDQPDSVRIFKDVLGINMTMKAFFTLTYHIITQHVLCKTLTLDGVESFPVYCFLTLWT